MFSMMRSFDSKSVVWFNAWTKLREYCMILFSMLCLFRFYLHHAWLIHLWPLVKELYCWNADDGFIAMAIIVRLDMHTIALQKCLSFSCAYLWRGCHVIQVPKTYNSYCLKLTKIPLRSYDGCVPKHSCTHMCASMFPVRPYVKLTQHLENLAPKNVEYTNKLVQQNSTSVVSGPIFVKRCVKSHAQNTTDYS